MDRLKQERMDKLKNDLKQYRCIMRNVEHLEERLARVDDNLYSLGGYTTSEKVQTTMDPDKWTELISKKAQLQNDINKKIASSYDEMMRLERIIESLNEKGKLLMRLRYIDGLTWEEVAVEMNYSWQHMHKLHSKCLKQVIECEY